ncbi:MAG TPA: carboxylesterase family protein [Bryobacteraceae bacterium]|nr:carboxylesterase family protein [Bryobacteraceae bacterium]
MRILLTIALAALPAFAADPPSVTLTAGQLRGAALDRTGAAFKGIPFAQPPVGDLRWRGPQAAKAWAGVRDATAFSAPCAQNSGGKMMESSSEDCLYLNVWTPDWPPSATNSRKPVMFWIHGGGNYGGTASGANFDGESLARHGVVVVTANYRLTIFGFFSHPELTRESQNHASGNYGLMDQIAALKWVHDNIARFGGDPGNVTVFGQSAGAVDANVLMTSPLAATLFQRVIAESGTVTRNPDAATMNMTALGVLMKVKAGPVTYSDAPLLLEAEQRGEALAASLNAPVPGSLKYLRGLPTAELLKPVAAPQMSIGPANGIVVDGYVIPKPPAEVFVTGKELRVPLLIGNNSRERTPPQVTAADLTAAASSMYGPLAPRAGTLYGLGGADTADPLYGGQAAQWVVDTMYRCPVVAQLNWHVAAGNAGFEYQFDRPAPGREALGATHGAEVPYVFGNLGPADGPNARYKDADRALSAAIEEYWTNFAKTGAPSPPQSSLPRWPKYDASARGYMEFTDNGPVAREALRRPFCDLYVENTKRLGAR